MAEQWQVQYFLMKEKLRTLKAQQRVMEVRALLNELRYHPLPGPAGSTLRAETRDSSGGFSSKGGKWVKGKGGKFVGSTGGGGSSKTKKKLTKYGRRDIIKIIKKERKFVTDRINEKFSSYHGAKHGVLKSYVLDAIYFFDIIEYDNYIITDKKPLEK